MAMNTMPCLAATGADPGSREVNAVTGDVHKNKFGSKDDIFSSGPAELAHRSVDGPESDHVCSPSPCRFVLEATRTYEVFLGGSKLSSQASQSGHRIIIEGDTHIPDEFWTFADSENAIIKGMQIVLAPGHWHNNLYNHVQLIGGFPWLTTLDISLMKRSSFDCAMFRKVEKAASDALPTLQCITKLRLGLPTTGAQGLGGNTLLDRVFQLSSLVDLELASSASAADATWARIANSVDTNGTHCVSAQKFTRLVLNGMHADNLPDVCKVLTQMCNLKKLKLAGPPEQPALFSAPEQVSFLSTMTNLNALELGVTFDPKMLAPQLAGLKRAANLSFCQNDNGMCGQEQLLFPRLSTTMKPNTKHKRAASGGSSVNITLHAEPKAQHLSAPLIAPEGHAAQMPCAVIQSPINDLPPLRLGDAYSRGELPSPGLTSTPVSSCPGANPAANYRTHPRKRANCDVQPSQEASTPLMWPWELKSIPSSKGSSLKRSPSTVAAPVSPSTTIPQEVSGTRLRRQTEKAKDNAENEPILQKELGPEEKPAKKPCKTSACSSPGKAHGGQSSGSNGSSWSAFGNNTSSCGVKRNADDCEAGSSGSPPCKHARGMDYVENSSADCHH